MDSLRFSVQNIIDGQGVDIALTGMLIVFSVLALISLFIVLLPKALGVVARYIPEVEHAPASPKSQDDDVVVAAIGYVMHTRLRGQL